MRRLVMLLLVAVACASKEERAREIAGARAARDSVRATEIVQSMQAPAAVGRLIYDPPTDLSYDSLRVKRPELLSLRDRPKR